MYEFKDNDTEYLIFKGIQGLHYNFNIQVTFLNGELKASTRTAVTTANHS